MVKLHPRGWRAPQRPPPGSAHVLGVYFVPQYCSLYLYCVYFQSVTGLSAEIEMPPHNEVLEQSGNLVTSKPATEQKIKWYVTYDFKRSNQDGAASSEYYYHPRPTTHSLHNVTRIPPTYALFRLVCDGLRDGSLLQLQGQQLLHPDDQGLLDEHEVVWRDAEAVEVRGLHGPSVGNAAHDSARLGHIAVCREQQGHTTQVRGVAEGGGGRGVRDPPLLKTAGVNHPESWRFQYIFS